MPVSVNYTVVPPIKVIQLNLSKTALQLKNFREPLRLAVKTVISQRFYENFDNSGAETAWKALAPRTVKYKFDHGYARYAFQPLQRKLTLQKAAGQQNIWTITNDAASVDKLPERAVYGYYHQFGYTSRGVNVVARPWAELTNPDIDRIETIFDLWAKAKFGIN